MFSTVRKRKPYFVRFEFFQSISRFLRQICNNMMKKVLFRSINTYGENRVKENGTLEKFFHCVFLWKWRKNENTSKGKKIQNTVICNSHNNKVFSTEHLVKWLKLLNKSKYNFTNEHNEIRQILTYFSPRKLTESLIKWDLDVNELQQRNEQNKKMFSLSIHYWKNE